MEGYKTEVVIPNEKKIKVWGNVITMLSLILANVLYMVIYKGSAFSMNLTQLIMLWILVFIGIFIHELLHIIAFLIGKVKLSELKVKFNKLGLNVTCKKVIKLGTFKVVMLIPLILTGLIPLLIGYIVKDLSLVNIGIILSCCSLGDVAGFLSLRKFPNDALIKDYEGKLGCEVYIKE